MATAASRQVNAKYLCSHVPGKHAGVDLELLDSLVTERKLLARLRILELKRSILSKELAVDSNQLLKSLLKRPHVRPFFLRHRALAWHTCTSTCTCCTSHCCCPLAPTSIHSLLKLHQLHFLLLQLRKQCLPLSSPVLC